MNRYDPNIHHRRSIRLKGYDYSQEGLYFITICCQDRACLFGRVVDGKMILNEYGRIACDEWEKTPEVRANVELGEFVVMPNHVHGIIRLNGRGGLNQPDINDKLHTSIESLGECNSFIERGECNSPQQTEYTINELHTNGERRGEMLSPNENSFDERGVLNMPQQTEYLHSTNDKRGECNSPLRGPSQTVGAIVRGYKSAVTKKLNDLVIGCAVWQRNYYEHIIRSERSYINIAEYIIDNPAKWEEDRFYKE